MSAETPQPSPKDMQQLPGQGQLFTEQVVAKLPPKDFAQYQDYRISAEEIKQWREDNPVTPNGTGIIDSPVGPLRSLQSEVSEISHDQAESDQSTGFFRRRWSALRNLWRGTKESKATEVLVAKPIRLIGEVALTGAAIVVIGARAYGNFIGRHMDRLVANLESQERDRKDGYDSYTPLNRVKSRVKRQPQKLRPPDVLDQLKNDKQRKVA